MQKKKDREKERETEEAKEMFAWFMGILQLQNSTVLWPVVMKRKKQQQIIQLTLHEVYRSTTV